MEPTIAQRNRAIKKALSEIYGSKNISLTGHRGTAYGWIDIKVNVPQPQHEHNFNHYNRCSICYELKRVDENRIRQVAHETAKNIGSYIGSFYSDDGYDTKHDNMLIDVNFVS